MLAQLMRMNQGYLADLKVNLIKGTLLDFTERGS